MPSECHGEKRRKHGADEFFGILAPRLEIPPVRVRKAPAEFAHVPAQTLVEAVIAVGAARAHPSWCPSLCGTLPCLANIQWRAGPSPWLDMVNRMSTVRVVQRVAEAMRDYLNGELPLSAMVPQAAAKDLFQ